MGTVILFAKNCRWGEKENEPKFLVNEEQCVKKVKELKDLSKVHKLFRRCFKIDLLIFFIFAYFMTLNSAF